MVTSFFDTYLDEPVEESTSENQLDTNFEVARIEVEQYKMFRPSAPEKSPLAWWKIHESQFSRLSGVAKSLLAFRVPVYQARECFQLRVTLLLQVVQI